MHLMVSRPRLIRAPVRAVPLWQTKTAGSGGFLMGREGFEPSTSGLREDSGD